MWEAESPKALEPRRPPAWRLDRVHHQREEVQQAPLIHRTRLGAFKVDMRDHWAYEHRLQRL